MNSGDPTPSLFQSSDPDPVETPPPAGPAARTPAAKAQKTSKAARSGTGKRGATAGTAAERAARTPMMQQYYRAKKEAGDALLMFRMGDFYELFHDDAKTAARVLGITLTSRSKGEGAIPMAGVPVKAYEGYVQSLIRAGFRVAVCDQVEDAAAAKGLVDRKVTRIVTAGTVFEDDLLVAGASNFLLAIVPGEVCGLAWIDVSTGDFRVTAVDRARLGDEVSRLDPVEIVLPESALDRGTSVEPGAEGGTVATLKRVTDAPLVAGPEWTFDPANAREALSEQLGTAGLAGFGLDDSAPYIGAAGAALSYVRDTQRGSAPPVAAIRLHDAASRADLDRATRSCLEVLQTQRDHRREGSLLGVVDRTATAMGARLLREWLTSPLIDVEAIGRRQGAVAELVERRALRERLADALGNLPDVERVATRLLAHRASPRDLAAVRTALRTVPTLREALQQFDAASLAEVGAALDPMPELADLLERALADPPAAVLAEGGVIAAGWNAELDELRTLHSNGTAAIARFQAAEAERIGIASLKVGYNRVFGYYIEITHAQAAGATIPDDYVRKQTLTSAERYISSELKELESSILTADERSRALEAELFADLRTKSAEHGEGLRSLARAVARLDVLCGFAAIADERGWARPVVDDGDVIDIHDGRHPVIEMTMPAGDVVPNDSLLDADTARLVLITGPNMSGKSTYIRQVALLVLLAQAGSFVPAASARIGVVDRIFTRLGSADDLSAGVSTFMLEMTETAAILNGATGRSLVILDEVGRGTSTWDGLSLAWAISEYLYNKVGARTLFATHYHELVDLAEELPAVRNVNVAVREWGDEIVFLHKIVPGGTDRSYGLHVARLAGVPRAVIDRAGRILSDLETRSPDLKPKTTEAPAGATEPAVAQGALFPRPAAAVLDEIEALDPDLVSPMDALVLLRRFCGLLGGQVTAEDEPGSDDGEA